MSSATTSARPARENVASRSLRSAGLLDRDARMKDLTDKPGGKKGSMKLRSHRPRPVDAFKDRPAASSSRVNALLSARVSSAASSDPLSIRGASKTATARVRRAVMTTGIGDPAIMRASRASPTPHSSVVEVWRAFVNRRYNPETQFLNLEAMADDPELKKQNMRVPGAAPHSREAAVIFKLAAALKPEVTTISLANNQISYSSILTTLSHYVPNLANLSLANNKFAAHKDIDVISGKKGRLTKLRELILTGNPFREMDVAAGKLEEYRAVISRKFPSLEMLDLQPVAKISFDAPQTTSASAAPLPMGPTATTFPFEMGPSFITGVDGAIVSNFLMRFLPLFDNQRPGLTDVYHPQATFSLSVNTAIPVRSRMEGFQHKLPNQQKLNWQPWLPSSRNLSRAEVGADKVLNTLHIGNDAIAKAIADMPKTTHDVQGAPEKFCLDAWPVVSGQTESLFISVHGQFIEDQHQGIRSFDRSFVLAPAPEGSRAKQAGWDVAIMSDQLVVRNYSTHEAWTPGPMKVQYVTSKPALPPRVLEDLKGVPEPQRALVSQVCQQSGLNVKFSVDCLQNNGWDVQRAMANFEQVKASLGKEAFS